MWRWFSFALVFLLATSLVFAQNPTPVLQTSNVGLLDLAVQTLFGIDSSWGTAQIGSDLSARAINSDLNGALELASDNTLYVAQTNGAGTAMFDKFTDGGLDGAGLVTRRARGTPSSPVDVGNGDQIGYMDFRSYSGTQFFQQVSIYAHVDGAFASGQAPPSRLAFATNSANCGGLERMRIDCNGYVYVNTTYQHPQIASSAYLTVKSEQNDWTSVIQAAPTSGPGYGLRVHTDGATAQDIPFVVSSGAGSGTVTFRVNGDGSVLYGTASMPTSNSKNVFVFGDNGAAPALGVSTAAIYNNGGEMFAMNSSGTATKISKHYDPDEAAKWGLDIPDSDLLPEIEYESNAFIGVEALTYTNPATGIRQRVTRPLDSSLRQDWTAAQVAAWRQREVERQKYEEAKARHAERNPDEPFAGVKPEEYVPVDPPKWMQRRGVLPLNAQAFYEAISEADVANANRETEGRQESARAFVDLQPELANQR